MQRFLFLIVILLGFASHSNVSLADSGIAESFAEKLFSDDDPARVVKEYMRPEVLAFIGSNMNTTLSQIGSYTLSFGDLQGVEVIREEEISDRMKRIAVVIYLDVLPMSAEIYLYRSNDKWWVNSFNFNTDMKYLRRKYGS